MLNIKNFRVLTQLTGAMLLALSMTGCWVVGAGLSMATLLDGETWDGSIYEPEAQQNALMTGSMGEVDNYSVAGRISVNSYSESDINIFLAGEGRDSSVMSSIDITGLNPSVMKRPNTRIVSSRDQFYDTQLLVEDMVSGEDITAEYRYNQYSTPYVSSLLCSDSRSKNHNYDYDNSADMIEIEILEADDNAVSDVQDAIEEAAEENDEEEDLFDVEESAPVVIISGQIVDQASEYDDEDDHVSNFELAY